MGKTSNEVKMRWNNAHYDRIEFTVPKGDKDKIKAEAEKRKMSLAEFIKHCINKEMK